MAQENKPIIWHTVVLEGIDKTGKNLIQTYIHELSGKKYVIHCRGIMSQLTYTLRYSRKYNYGIDPSTCRDLIVLLDVDKDDWLIRCKNAKERLIDYETDVEAFNETYRAFEKLGYKLLRFNTSHTTPYDIAKKIIEVLESLENE